MRRTSWILAAFLLLGTAGLALAQAQDPPSSSTGTGTTTEPAPPPSTTPGTSEAPAAPTAEPAKAAPPKPARASSERGVPAAELKKLDFLKGTWNSKVTMGEGTAGPASGKAQYDWMFQGMHLEGDHSYTIGGKPMKGRTTWGWDAEKQQYQLLWVNSMDSSVKTYYGTFPNESSLAFFTTYMMDGKAVTEKIAFTFPDPNSYVFTVENDLSGTMAKVMEETATRGAANAKASTKSTGAKSKGTSKPATASTTKKAG